MKTMAKISVVGFIFLLNAFITRADLPISNNLALDVLVPAPTSFKTTEVGPNHRVLQRESYRRSKSGEVITNIQSYTELASGLNYQDESGAWRPSKEIIESFSGGAIARQGQHKVIFANNLNSSGSIDIQTPDGKRLRSNILGLFYHDKISDNIIKIGEIQDCVGKLVSSNQVLYTNAFANIQADVRYTYKRSGFEQDVILRCQLPPPDKFNMDSSATEIIVMTEFISPPQETVTDEVDSTDDNPDQNISWGAIKIGKGAAFDCNTSTRILVRRQYLSIQGRHFLVETVPFRKVNPFLSTLPLQSSITTPKQIMAFKDMTLPERPAKQGRPQEIQLAMATQKMNGFILDYLELNTDTNDFIFQGDTTYYVSGNINVNSGATLKIEGGTVIKFAPGCSINSLSGALVSCPTSPYRPAIFTAVDDDTAGEPISGSTGSPSGYYASPALNIDSYGDLIFSGLRMRYAEVAINSGFNTTSITVKNCQFVNCYEGLQSVGAIYLRNTLFANLSSYCIDSTINNSLWMDAENVTFANIFRLGLTDISSSSWYSANCIYASVSQLIPGLTLQGDYNGFYGTSGFGSHRYTSSSYPFKVVGAGNYYLTNSSIFHSVGRTNIIDPALLADIRDKTTYSPAVVYSNCVITTNITFLPQATRDNASTIDLGYHYDPIDYLCGDVNISNCTLVVSNGAVVGGFSASGLLTSLQFDHGATLICKGTPNKMNRFVECSTVQEQALVNGWYNGDAGCPLLSDNLINQAAIARYDCRFTEWSCLADDCFHLYVGNTNTLANLQDCQLHGSSLNELDGNLNLTNCLLNRVKYRVQPKSPNIPCIQNITMFGGVLNFQILNTSGACTNINVKNCFFDQCSGVRKYYPNICYNAYTTNSIFTAPNPLHTGDVIFGAPFDYQSSWFGNFYQPSSSLLINNGVQTANQVGLYHYTTQSTQIKETNSIVDMGYHYVATDANGQPMDSNSNGIPDYIEDYLGQGQGLTVILTSPTNNSTYSEPANIPLLATVFDWASSVTNLSFCQGTNIIKVNLVPPYQYSWPLVSAGVYSITAVAHDAAGSGVTSSAASITVTNLCGY